MNAPLALKPAVLFIDGHSGSGKTMLADGIAAESGAALLRLDDLYPGWDGLAAGSRAVADALRDREYRRYDWLEGTFMESRRLDPTRPLVIEGCGAVTVSNLSAARDFAGLKAKVWSVWLECPEALRQARSLDRDGQIFAPHWSNWVAQEEAYFYVERPLALVNEICHMY